MTIKDFQILGESETGVHLIVGKDGILNKFIFINAKMMLMTFIDIGINITKENKEWVICRELKPISVIRTM